MEQVEVALRNLREADQRIDRAEARTKREVPRILLVDRNNQVLATGNWGIRILRASIHFFEILQTLEALFAALNANHVESLAWGYRQLTPDHFVLCFRIAADLNLLNDVLLTLVDLKIQIHRAGLGIG